VYSLDGRAASKSLTVEFERRVRERLSPSDSIEWLNVSRAHVFSESALSDDLYAAVGNDTLMIMVSIVLMSAYVSLFLSRHRDALHWRAIPAGGAVFSVLLATLTAFGVGSVLGVEYNDNCNLAIFVILGVGVDDAFVIVRALDDIPTPVASSGAKQTTHERISERVGAALGACGSAILLSSTTNAIAFALGTNSPLPALQGFCAYAALGMVFDFFFQLTFFVAVVAIDEQRRSYGRAVIPCFHAKGSEGSDSSTKRCEGRFPTGGRWTDVLRATVLCTYVATLGLAICASWYLRVGFRPEELVSPSSSVARYFDAQARLFPSSPELVEVVVLHNASGKQTAVAPMPLLDDGTFTSLEQIRGALFASDNVHQTDGSKAITSLWTVAFARRQRDAGLRAPSELSPSELDAAISSFLTTADAAVIRNTGGLIVREGVLVATSWKVLFDDYGPDAMVRLRSALQLSGVDHSAFAFSVNDVYYEQDAGLLTYTRDSLLMVMGAVLAAVFVLTLDFAFVCMMGACTLSCVAHLIGWMFITSIQLSSISLVPLLLSVGLCIDYCTHIAHAYSEAHGTPHERVMTALRTRGAAVLNAGVSTGISVVLLAFGESAIFTTFFWLLLGVVVVGLYHALLVLPACLSMLPDCGPQQGLAARDSKIHTVNMSPLFEMGATGGALVKQPSSKPQSGARCQSAVC